MLEKLIKRNLFIVYLLFSIIATAQDTLVTDSLVARKVEEIISNKEPHFTLFGHNKDGKGIREISVNIDDTLYHSFFNKHKDSVRYHKRHFNHLKQYESGLYEVHMKSKNLHELFDDITKVAGVHFTLIGNTNIKITSHIESFSIDYLVDELCYQHGFIAVKEHNRFTIYGNGAKDIIEKNKIAYQYNPRNTKASELKNKVDNLGTEAELHSLEDQNIILVSGNLKNIQDAIVKLRTLDIEPKKVSIELLVVEYNHGHNFNWDFDITSGQSGRTSNFNYSPGGGLSFGYNFLSSLNPSFKFNLKALVENNYANVVTNPHVMALNNEEANIDISETVYIKLEVASINGASALLQEVSTGISLKVTPNIMSNSLMRLEVAAHNSIFLPVETNGVINTQKNELNTNVMIRNGETLIIGGLISARESEGKGGFPILRHIPIIGLLFQNISKRNEYIETVIYITPYMNPLKDDQLIHSAESVRKVEEKLKNEGKKIEREGIRKSF